MCVCVCVHACACVYVHASKWENKLCHVIAEVQKLLVRRFFSIHVVHQVLFYAIFVH